MTKPMVRIHNTQTNEVIDREMTDAEYLIYQAEAKSYEDFVAQTLQSVNAKTAAQAKLAALGLTTDDLKALGL